MTEGFIQVAVDSTGKQVRNVHQTVGANDVYQQVVTLAKSDATLLDTQLAGMAQEGVDGSGITAPAGGSGIRGWLSGIYKAVTGTLTVDPTDRSARLLGHVTVDTAPAVTGSVTVSNLPTTQAISGSVNSTLSNPQVFDELLLEMRKQTLALQLLCWDHGFTNTDLLDGVA